MAENEIRRALLTNGLCTELPQDDATHSLILGHFASYNGLYRVEKVFQITNHPLAQEYLLFKSTLIDDIGEQHLNERSLFHGTKTTDAVCGIAKEGFDWRLNGTNGTAFGKGSYFSSHLPYSAEGYTQADEQGLRFVFIARVLLGKSAPAKQSDVRPPAGCHSTASLPNNMHITFHIKQAYPQYLVFFKKTTGNQQQVPLHQLQLPLLSLGYLSEEHLLVGGGRNATGGVAIDEGMLHSNEKKEARTEEEEKEGPRGRTEEKWEGGTQTMWGGREGRMPGQQHQGPPDAGTTEVGRCRKGHRRGRGGHRRRGQGRGEGWHPHDHLPDHHPLEHNGHHRHHRHHEHIGDSERAEHPPIHDDQFSDHHYHHSHPLGEQFEPLPQSHFLPPPHHHHHHHHHRGGGRRFGRGGRGGGRCRQRHGRGGY